MSNCRHCAIAFEPTSWQAAKSDFECPPCRKARGVAYRLARKEAGRPVISAPVPAERKRAYATEYFKDPENRARRNALMRKYRRAHATEAHHIARVITHKAIRAGRLAKQPCEVCGEVRVEAHHDDYGKPLDVRWLCPPHHREHHKATAAATGAK